MNDIDFDFIGTNKPVPESTINRWGNRDEQLTAEADELEAQLRKLQLKQQEVRAKIDAASTHNEMHDAGLVSNVDALRPIHHLNLSVAARKATVKLRVETIGELCTKTEDDILEVAEAGPSVLNEISEKLDVIGLQLSDN